MLRSKLERYNNNCRKLLQLTVNQATHIEQLRETISRSNLPHEKELDEVRKIPEEKGKDTKFVQRYLEVMYKENLQALDTRTVTGLGGKLITPEKWNAMHQDFKKRIADDRDHARNRESYFNRVVKNSISQIRSKNRTAARKAVRHLRFDG